jgi:hypothetical protein
MVAVQLAICEGGGHFWDAKRLCPEGKQGVGTPGGASIDMIIKAINLPIH